MRHTVRTTMAALAVVAAGTLLAGCGGDAGERAAERSVEKAIEDGAADSGEDVDVDIEDDKVTIEGEDGTTTWGGTDRPESLPEDFPLAEGEITYAMDSPDGAMVTIEVDDAAQAFDDALADLEGQGWKRVSVTEAETGSIAMLQGESDTQSVVITSDPSSDTLSYLVSLRE
ncbi:MAG: hypothetical protein LT071_01910 [Nocardioides sp.]|nr:hypothetical protein [Nocardioides sp.]